MVQVRDRNPEQQRIEPQVGGKMMAERSVSRPQTPVEYPQKQSASSHTAGQGKDRPQWGGRGAVEFQDEQQHERQEQVEMFLDRERPAMPPQAGLVALEEKQVGQEGPLRQGHAAPQGNANGRRGQDEE